MNRQLSILFLLFCLAPTCKAAESFSIEVSDGDIWLKRAQGDKASFEFRIGAGGSVSSIRNATAGKDLLAPPFAGEITDRVIQLVTWDVGNQIPEGSGNYNDYWNVDQAGNEQSDMQAVVSAKISADRRRLDIYTVADSQWKSHLRAPVGQAFAGRVSMLTRYDLQDNGTLSVRRIVYHDAPLRRDEGKTEFEPLPWRSVLHQNWIPFIAGSRASDRFDAVCLKLKADGKPTTSYEWRKSIPKDSFKAEQGTGYGVIHHSDDKNGDFVAVILGKRPVKSPYAASWALLLADYEFEQYGVQVVAPEMHIEKPQAGFVIDSSIALVVGHGLDRTVARTIELANVGLPQPVVYSPDAAYGDELRPLVDRLRANIGLDLTEAMRVDHLASRLDL